MDQEQVLLSIVVSGSGSAEAFRRSVEAARRACRNAEGIEVLCLVDGSAETERRLRESHGTFSVVPATKLSQWDRMIRGRFVQFVRPGQELSPAWFRMALLAFREEDLGAVRGRIQPRQNGARQAPCGGWLIPRSLLTRLPEGTRPFGHSFEAIVQASIEAVGLRAAELEIPMVYQARQGLCASCRSAYLRGQSSALSAIGPGEACLFAPVASPVRWAFLWVLLVSTACVFPGYAALLIAAWLLHATFAFRSGPSGIGWRSRCAASVAAPFKVFPEALGVVSGLLTLWRTARRPHLIAQATQLTVRTQRLRDADRPSHAYLRDGVSLS